MIFNAERYDNSDIIKTFAAGFARLSFNSARCMYNYRCNIKDLAIDDIDESSLSYNMSYRDDCIQYNFGNESGDMLRNMMARSIVNHKHHALLDLESVRIKYEGGNKYGR